MTNYFDLEKKATLEDKRLSLLLSFLERYKPTYPNDLYQWLWEGEFGTVKCDDTITHSLWKLNEDVDLAYEDENTKEEEKKEIPVCEKIGFSGNFLKVNLLPYARNGCPLKQLVELKKFAPHIRGNRFRFKQDWLFLKKQVQSDMNTISQKDFADFENEIDFHVFQKLNYTENFLTRYHLFSRVLPTQQFFHSFPEYQVN